MRAQRVRSSHRGRAQPFSSPVPSRRPCAQCDPTRTQSETLLALSARSCPRFRRALAGNPSPEHKPGDIPPGLLAIESLRDEEYQRDRGNDRGDGRPDWARLRGFGGHRGGLFGGVLGLGDRAHHSVIHPNELCGQQLERGDLLLDRAQPLVLLQPKDEVGVQVQKRGELLRLRIDLTVHEVSPFEL